MSSSSHYPLFDKEYRVIRHTGCRRRERENEQKARERERERDFKSIKAEQKLRAKRTRVEEI